MILTTTQMSKTQKLMAVICFIVGWSLGHWEAFK